PNTTGPLARTEYRFAFRTEEQVRAGSGSGRRKAGEGGEGEFDEEYEGGEEEGD
ncbi:MAG: hypothetical protein Q9201_006682, partial [Fulgogasparrea decipioides]